MTKEIDYISLFSLVLPSGLLEYFNMIGYEIGDTRIDLYLEENIYIPDGYNESDIFSHGFMRERVIQDFPFRDKSLYLHLKRRRYIDKSTGSTVSRDLSYAFEGTHLTAEFAAFLKDIYR